MRKFSVLVMLGVSAIMLSGCATLFKGPANMVDFSSDPSGAKVYVNGNLMGTTPVKLKLESKRTYHIEFKKEGYETKIFNITNSVGVGWVVLDILAGFVPVIVDAATGCWYELDQDKINAILGQQQ